MDRLTQLRGVAGGSGDSSLDTSASPSEAYMTANESSKYFSLTEDDSSFDITPIKDVSLASTTENEKTVSGNDQLISNLSPTAKKRDLLGDYKIGKQIEAANILSGGVDIFDDNENSYDGDELVIDDNVDDKSNPEIKVIENTDLPFQKTEEIAGNLYSEPAIGSKDSEVVLQIDGNNVHAIDIGNGLYLYRKHGEEELAAVQIVADDQDQPTFKFLKVRENAEGNLEVYEEIEIEVPKEVPTKVEKLEKITSHVPIKDINKVISDPVCCNKVAERKKPQDDVKTIASTSENDESHKGMLSESNLNGKMMKYNETRKSPVIHSTPNKEGIPLTKTMVDMQLHLSRPLDKVKTIEVHTDNIKQRTMDSLPKKESSDDQKDIITTGNEIEKSLKIMDGVKETIPEERKTDDHTVYINKQSKSMDEINTKSDVCTDTKHTSNISPKLAVSTENNIKNNSKANEENKSEIITNTLCVSKNVKILDIPEKLEDIPEKLENIPEKLEDIPEKLEDDVTNQKVISNLLQKTQDTVMSESGSQSVISKIENVKSVSDKEHRSMSEDKGTEITLCPNKKPSVKQQCSKVPNETFDILCSAKEKKPKAEDTEQKPNINIQDSKTLDTSLDTSDNNEGRESKVPVEQKLTMNAHAEDLKVPAKQNYNLKGQYSKPSQGLLDTANVKDLKVPTKQILNSKQDLNILDTTKEKNINVQDLKYDKNKEGRKESSSLQITKEKVITDSKSVDEVMRTVNIKAKRVDENPTIPTQTKNETLSKTVKADSKSNIEQYHQILLNRKSEPDVQETANILDKRIPKGTSVVDIKNSEQNLPSQTEPLDNKNMFKDQVQPPDQGKLLISNVVEGSSVSDAKQASSSKCFVSLKEPTTAKKPVMEEIVKESSKSQQSTQPTCIKNQNESKPDFKTSKLPVVVTMGPQKKIEAIKVSSTSVERKPVLNNNAAVPFGQWTSANRQEFLNKIKEHKIPVSVSNTKSISKPNDLNRRDVLQKIDSQRQSCNAAAKIQEIVRSKKNETPTFINKPSANQSNTVTQESKVPSKDEALKSNPLMPKKVERPVSGETSHKALPNITVSSKSEGTNRNEFNNQDLIDKTVEGIINKAVSAKQQESKPNMLKDSIKHTLVTGIKSKDDKPDFDAIEMQMNELHGIPFVERPPHELPKICSREIKTYAKADTAKQSTQSTNKVTHLRNILPINKLQQKIVKDDVIDLDSEEEVIEHEPITGDIDLRKSKQSTTSNETNVAQVGSDSSKKGSIITEKDFDKFARRNSITYENCLTVNIEKNKNRNIVQGLVQKDGATDLNTKKETSEFKISSPKQKPVYYLNNQSNKIHVTSKLVPVGEDAFNKNYQSKLQLAYQTALTTKRQMESPVTILEDKPVKVVFMDSNTNFQASQLNFQGQSLSPTKKTLMPKEADPTTICDPIDSEIIESVEDLKPLDEIKSNKTKHQRKQVLTPVETPELELIVPGDLGIEVSPKRKRRTDDFKLEKTVKNLVPKKTYLLGRNSKSPALQDPTKEPSKPVEEKNNVIVSHNDTASAIDNLVKAAELIENQSGNFKVNSDANSQGASPVTSVKRGRGRPRKYPLSEGTQGNSKAPSPQKKPRLIDTREKSRARQSTSDEDNSDDSEGDRIVRENWTMGKINENIVCPICNKLFRSENVVFKHVKHCTGPSPNRSDSDKRSCRRSRLSYDSKSMGSKLDDTDGETDSVVSKKSAPKKRKTKEPSSDEKDIIVIEDTPVKTKAERSVEPKQHESRDPNKTKAYFKTSTLSCEHCGKTFRQLSYLVSHKLLHRKPNTQKETPSVGDKSVFSCEVCKKEFRKLHHLVQHRIIHNPSILPKSYRKSSSEQESENKMSKGKEIKQAEDLSAAFRCEPCDKSFRKLHHLVEHRETHDGINKKATPVARITEKVIQNPPLPPQCDICKKSFRKLHHLIEHKEQHQETSSEKSDDKSVKSALSTKDIIHECSLCYMVFPNEHSLNKHSVFCQKKKRQSAKQSKQSDEAVEKGSETPTAEKENATLEPSITKSDEIVGEVTPKNVVEILENRPMDAVYIKTDNVPETKENPLLIEENIPTVLPIVSSKNNLKESKIVPPIPTGTDLPKEKPQDLKKTEEDSEIEFKITANVPNKKNPVKVVSAAKRRKSNIALARIKENPPVESSDDEEVRYMLNPEYNASPSKPDVDTSEGRLFMKIRAKKRSSLQFERPTSKDLMKRRTSVQDPAKVPRLKAKIAYTNQSAKLTTLSNISEPDKLESLDSDDSEIKYAFPEKAPVPEISEKSPKEKRKSISEKAHKAAEPERPPKEKKKSLIEKRKSLSGIARRKSLGKTVSVKQKKEKDMPVEVIKRRREQAEHRCDCGQLFSSAALLARHTSLAHTPPRVRRRRSSPPPATAPPKPTLPKPTLTRPKDIRKSTARSETENATSPKKQLGKTPRTPARKSTKGEPSAAARLQSSRKKAAHRGVPVPEKMKKIMEKLKK